MSPTERLAALLVAAAALLWLLGLTGLAVPSRLLGITTVSAILAGIFLLVRLVGAYRHRLLWRLRNRLIAAYIFIAVVPMILLITIGALTSRILYKQFSAYVIKHEVEGRVEKLAEIAEILLVSTAESREDAAPASRVIQTHSTDLPGLRIEFTGGDELLKIPSLRFAGLVQSGERVELRAVAVQRPGGRRVSLSAPVNQELLATLAPELGPLKVTIMRPARDGEANAIPLGKDSSGRERHVVAIDQIETLPLENRPAPQNWLDYEVDGVAELKVAYLHPDGAAEDLALYASVYTRPAVLNKRLFGELGQLGGLWVTFLLLVIAVFFILELAALITGIILTRTITTAVADLYSATEYVQRGDFTHRVRSQQKDQLGALGESFNAMIGSIGSLIEEQKQRQRLENELAIAQQVQSQLFPQELPRVAGVDLAAVCRAARVVSGDYYDFIPLSSQRLAIALADISGKGISAALLMASLQAALRSQVLLNGNMSGSTAELVSHVNRHLYVNTSADRYATLFYAVYDGEQRILHYTNAGHLPPFLVAGEKVHKLEEGGMVVGLFDDCHYQQGSIRMEPGSLLVAYSDGLIEPENVYGEQFGIDRLAEELLRHRGAAPQNIVESLMAAADEWGGSPEQADDMTVVVARLG